jgi:cytochrome P450
VSFGLLAVPVANRFDSLRYSIGHSLPRVLQGSVIPRNRWVSFFSRVHPDPLAVRITSRLRRKYGDYLFIDMLGHRALLVLDEEGVRSVLERSPAVYAEPAAKRKALSHFQPGALTISRGAEWQDRRRFNEAVLDTNSRVHIDGNGFHRVAVEETDRMLDGARTRLGWPDFEALFEQLTLRVVLGDGARRATSLTGHLRAMMNEANRPFGLGGSAHFEPFYDELRSYLMAGEAGSLAARCRHAPASDMTRVENQVSHWIFATRETLAVNVCRALAAIAAHPSVQAAVRAEIRRTGISREGVDRMRLLEGCLEEAMRLWPTSAMLLREAVVDDVLGRHPIAAGTLVVIPNGYHHRNVSLHPFADRFAPELWADGPPAATFNHMSHGPQACAGRNLALFLGKAMLSTVLDRVECRLVTPALDPTRPLPHAFDPYRLNVQLFA